MIASLLSNACIDSYHVLAFGGGMFERELASKEEVVNVVLWDIS